MFLILFNALRPRYIRGLLFSIVFFLPGTLFAGKRDNTPRPVTICSGANIVVMGDALLIPSINYSWEIYQNNAWTTAPGANNASDYLASSLLNLTAADVVFNLRRRISVLGLPVYDSYYMITVQPILPILNNSITAPAVAGFCGTGSPAAILGTVPSSGNAVFLYQWQSSSDNLLFNNIDGANAKDYLPGPLNATLYFRRIAITGGCGLTNISNVVTISVQAEPSIPEVMQSSLSICAGSAAVLSVKNPQPGVAYKWYDSPAKQNLLFTGANYLTEVLNLSKIYYVVGSNGTCLSAASQQVEVLVLPKLSAVSLVAEEITASGMTFKWNAVPGATGYQISLDGGLTYVNPSSGANGLSHVLTGLNGKQRMQVKVKAIGSLSCQESSAAALDAETLSPFDDIYVPNAFTPNGDGKNDVVYVRSETVKELGFYVYSQWGQQIFYSANIAQGWDGTFKGSPQPVGVYVYHLKATMNNGRELTKKGTITLIK